MHCVIVRRRNPLHTRAASLKIAEHDPRIAESPFGGQIAARLGVCLGQLHELLGEVS